MFMVSIWYRRKLQKKADTSNPTPTPTPQTTPQPRAPTRVTTSASVLVYCTTEKSSAGRQGWGSQRQPPLPERRALRPQPTSSPT